MTNLERLADTLRKFNPQWSEQYRDLCRQIADDFGLAGVVRSRFLYDCKAFKQ